MDTRSCRCSRIRCGKTFSENCDSTSGWPGAKNNMLQYCSTNCNLPAISAAFIAKIAT